MASNSFPLCFSGNEKVLLTKWKVTNDFMINQNPFVLFLYKTCDKDGQPQGSEQKYKVNQSGITVRRLYKKVGELIEPEDVLLEFEPCSHSTLMKDMCAICGANINNLDTSEQRKIVENTSVSMVHSIPELRVSKQIAEDLGRADENRLLKARKLVLLVDLDQTIIHSTNQEVPSNAPDIYHYQLYGPNSPWYHTKFRPYMMEFLEEISKYYELHICTFGARRYAHQICHLIDPQSRYFPQDRILSRDEFFDPRSKTGNMKSLFPCGDSMVCIIDDRVDVWNYAPNVVHVKPYLCFQTDDINAPEKLQLGFANPENVENVDQQEKEKEKKASTTSVNNEYQSTVKTKTDADNTDTATSAPDNSKTEVNVETTSTLNEDCSEKYQAKQTENQTTEVKTEIEDTDDYLLYLKDILIRIHKEYYKQYEHKIRFRSEGEEILIPDLKQIIPQVRKLILHGVNIVFSGVIATNMSADSNRYYRLAQSMGAIITNDVIVSGSPRTTHLVGAKWGTIKVNKCLKHPNIKLVTPDWLIACAQRWERVEEKLYQLDKDSHFNVNEREDCRKVFIPYFKPPTPNRSVGEAEPNQNSATVNDQSKTMLDFSPLSNFSMVDLSEMGKEVDDFCSDEDPDSDTEDNDNNQVIRHKINKPDEDDDEDADDTMSYENEGEYPKGWRGLFKGIKRPIEDSDNEDEFTTSGEDEDDVSLGSLDEEAAELERQFQQDV